MDFDSVSPSFVIGCRPGSLDDAAVVRASGATAVLNVQSPANYKTWPVDADALAIRYQELGIVEVRCAVVGVNPEVPMSHYVRVAVAELHKLVQKGHTVYVHCTGGKGRAPTVVAAYLCWVLKEDVDAAAQRIVEARPAAEVNTTVVREVCATPFNA